jgi:hypothetical protein
MAKVDCLDSPLSPVIAHLFMEDFEKKAIELATTNLYAGSDM